MTQVTISSAIANISATTPVVTFAQVPAGSHRKLYLIVGMRNGAGNAAPPTAVSVGTIAMTRTAGQLGATDRVSASLWELDEDGIDAMSDNGAAGYNVGMSGQSGTIRTVLTLCVADTNQVDASTATSTYTATSALATALSLARVAESLTLFVAYCQTASTLTLANPTRDITFNDTSNGTQFNIGFEPDTLRTADSTYSALGSPVSAFTVNIAPYVANPRVVSVNGETEPELEDGEQDVTIIVEDMATITAIDYGGAPLDFGGAGTTYTTSLLERTDGREFPSLPAVVTLTVTDSLAVTADIDIDVTLQVGEAKVVLAGANTELQQYITYQLDDLGYSVADGVELYYPTFDGALTIGPDGYGHAVPLVDEESLPVFVLWHKDLDDVWNSFDVTLTLNDSAPDGPLVAVVPTATQFTATTLTASTF